MKNRPRIVPKNCAWKRQNFDHVGQEFGVDFEALNFNPNLGWIPFLIWRARGENTNISKGINVICVYILINNHT